LDLRKSAFLSEKPKRNLRTPYSLFFFSFLFFSPSQHELEPLYAEGTAFHYYYYFIPEGPDGPSFIIRPIGAHMPHFFGGVGRKSPHITLLFYLLLLF
jgi:hypothetical protein